MHAGLGNMQKEVWATALSHRLNEEFDNEEQVMEEATCLLKRCVNMRFVEGADFIATLKAMPYHPMGHALWQCFISGDPTEIHTELPETPQDENDILENYTNMSEWLDGECGIKERHLAKHYADETKSWHAEHVAAINGDVMMLCWLLKEKYEYCRMHSDRPKPRNERVVRELLVTTKNNEETTNNSIITSLPRDDDSWTPLHHAASRGNFNIIDAYRIKGEERSAFRFNTWFPGIDEFHAKTLNGQTALDLASDDPTRGSLLNLEKRLYQGILNGAIRNGRLPIGIADFAQLESLVAQHGLDVDEAAIVDEDDPFNRDCMTMALESGNPIQVQSLVRMLDLKDLKSWRNKDGKGMLHVAAGRSASWRSQVRNDDSYLRRNTHEQTRHADEQRDKLVFMEHHWNHGNAAFYSEGKKYVQGFAVGQPCCFD